MKIIRKYAESCLREVGGIRYAMGVDGHDSYLDGYARGIEVKTKRLIELLDEIDRAKKGVKMPIFTLTQPQAAIARASLRVAEHEHGAGQTGIVIAQIYEEEAAPLSGIFQCKLGFVPADKAILIKEILEEGVCKK